MGIVYKAIDLRLNRPVAIKFVRETLTRDNEANQRFRQEAQAASALDHPSICTIHEIDETPAGELFLVMAYYAGETLKQRIDRGRVSVDETLDVAIQVANALTRAHEAGIVHRDIKPANLILTSEGLAKILDFGLVKLARGGGVTRTGLTLGTVAYMSPEQARGELVDTRTDLWSLGVVLFEMLAGGRPFDGKDDIAVLSRLVDSAAAPNTSLPDDIPSDLRRIVARLLEKNPAARYQTAAELAADLTRCRTARTAPVVRSAGIVTLLRRPVVAIPLAVVLLSVAIPAGIAVRRNAQVRWAREDAIPQIMRLTQTDDYAAAFALAKEAERLVPGDPVLASLWPQFSVTGSLVTTPAGADVYVQSYGAESSEWDHLGQTPLENVRLARGVYRFRIEKAGFEARLLVARNPGPLLGGQGAAARRGPNALPISLLEKSDRSKETVPIPGGAFPVGLTGFNSDQRVAIGEFLIDRVEVTNADFKQFVDAGGYANPQHWKDLSFVLDGREIPFQKAFERFMDSTGRPGPAGWELSAYPAQQGDLPVTGVSWHEAVAYCRFVGKTLPSLLHWARAALSPAEIGSPLAPAIIPLSNFAGKGLAAVGSYRGAGPYGTFDMAGNAREWVWNEAAEGRRWILGGAWNDADYLFTVPSSLPPFDRSATNGFRCAQYKQPASAQLLARLETYARDHQTASAVSDEIYKVFARQYTYVTFPLNDRIDSRDQSPSDWVRETISFDAGYETGRVTANVFLPKNAQPPFQTVVVFPGVGEFGGRRSLGEQPPFGTDYLLRAGRAVVMPVYKGSFDRWDQFLTLQGEEYLRTFRTRLFHWRHDLGRVIDVLAARGDIDTSRIVYYGVSFGGSTALPLVALESRLKAAILAPAGFTYRELPPEADAINYLGRVTMPVLMMAGRHDYIFPLETAQKPFFERLGTPPEQKRHVVFETGHMNFPRSELIREVLGWLDRYLGPVKTPQSARTNSP
jgi:formylglycine-generating enzyme required for sulfatase activity/dienelactone hydrolase